MLRRNKTRNYAEMSRLATLLSVLVVVAARTTWKDLDNYNFGKYVEEFGFSWKDAEYTKREQIFAKELARVRAHNAAGKSWKEGVNKFSAMTVSEKQAYMGRSKGAFQKQQPKFKQPLPSDFVIKPVSELSTRRDWRESNIVSPVKDQGHCGSCWAFASTAVIESHVAKASGLLFELSVQQMAMCAPNPEACGGTGGCAGSTAELAFDYVAGIRGMYQEYQQGYAAYTGVNSACALPAGSPKAAISGYVQLPENNYTALLNAIDTVGPIAVSVDASSWHAYETGVFSEYKTNPDINHAVVLVGYGEDELTGKKFWLVRNSWSPTYGEIGFIRVERNENDEANCGMDVTPQHGTACAGDNTPVKVCGSSGILYDSAYPVGARSL